MKYRSDFVTNSSSASFVIQRRDVTDPQVFLIVHYRELCEQMGIEYDNWHIEYDDEVVSGFTTMENEDMLHLMTERIGIPRSVIKYDED